MKNGVELLNILANMLQVLNYTDNVEQNSNDDILKAINRQNTEYLEEILKILKEKNNDL